MTAPREADRLDPSIWKICAVAVLGAFLTQLDATVVNVSLSSLATTLHGTLSTIHWVTSGYLLALALMLPLSGWMVDRIGAKAVYIGCFAAFTVASALCGLAWSANSLIGFRILQGMSAGPLAPMAQMMVARAAGKRMASVLGFAALPILLAPLLGPVIAGAILQFASWRWLFLVNLPVGVVALVLAVIFLPNDREATQPRALDLVGWALLSPGLVLFLYGSDHIRDPVGILSLSGAVVLLVTFSAWAARKQGDALIDLRLFKGNVFSASAVTQFMANGVSFAGQMLIPIFLIRVGGRSPSATGLLLAPLGIGMMCGYPLIGTWVKRFGNRKVSATGATLALVGTLPFMYMPSHGLNIVLLAGALFVRGVGQSAIGVPSISAAYSAVERADLPMATTTLNIVMRLGGPTLTTLSASFLAWRLGPAPDHDGMVNALTATFILLCTFQSLLIAAAMRLPISVVDAAGKESPARPLPSVE